MGNCIQKNRNSENTRSSREPKTKNAVLIGLNYTGTPVELHGCINDANRMKKILQTKYKYKDVKVLTDLNLTKEHNILQILEELIYSRAKIMYFQYSGHGTQTYDRNGDELDGLDEVLYSVNGTLIKDDDINRVIESVPAGCTMIMVIDACHSGSIVDLPYQMDTNFRVKKISNKEIEANIICITGSRDNQVSLDIKDKNMWYGAMSNALQEIIKLRNIKNMTWRQLIVDLRMVLKKGGYAQVPQLCTSKKELMDQTVAL